MFDGEKGEEPKREESKNNILMYNDSRSIPEDGGQTDIRRPANKSFLELRIEKWGSEVENKPF